MEETRVTIEMICPFCEEPHRVTVKESEYKQWKRGVLAQVAFPNLSSTGREQLISNICPECQTKMFGFED